VAVPEGQPPWAPPSLLGIAVLAALLYSWNITQVGLAPFLAVMCPGPGHLAGGG
jgi:hypothetical protein